MSNLMDPSMQNLICSMFTVDETTTPEAKKLAFRARMEALENYMRQFPSIEEEVEHHFSDHVYARELRVKRDSLIMGKIHKRTNLNILAKGEMTVMTEDGIKRVKAPYVVVSPPGTKRLGYAHDDCVWITVHGTNETDLDKIEDFFIAKSFGEIDLLDHENKQIRGDA